MRAWLRTAASESSEDESEAASDLSLALLDYVTSVRLAHVHRCLDHAVSSPRSRLLRQVREPSFVIDDRSCSLPGVRSSSPWTSVRGRSREVRELE